LESSIHPKHLMLLPGETPGMRAGRLRRRMRLRVVRDEPMGDPRDPRIWRKGLNEARAALAGDPRQKAPVIPLAVCAGCGRRTPYVLGDQPLCRSCELEAAAHDPLPAAHPEPESEPAQLPFDPLGRC